ISDVDIVTAGTVIEVYDRRSSIGYLHGVIARAVVSIDRRGAGPIRYDGIIAATVIEVDRGIRRRRQNRQFGGSIVVGDGRRRARHQWVPPGPIFWSRGCVCTAARSARYPADPGRIAMRLVPSLTPANYTVQSCA